MLDNYINPAKYSGVAKEDTLQEVKNTVEGIDLSSVESKVDEIGNKIDDIQLPEIDTTELAKEESLNTSTDNILSALSGISASMYKGIPVVYDEDDDNVECYPNIYYICGERSELNIHRMEPTNIDIVNNYIFRFTASQDDMNVTLNGWDEISWFGGSIPTWVAGNTYEISIVDNIALWAEFEPVAV